MQLRQVVSNFKCVMHKVVFNYGCACRPKATSFRPTKQGQLLRCKPVESKMNVERINQILEDKRRDIFEVNISMGVPGEDDFKIRIYLHMDEAKVAININVCAAGNASEDQALGVTVLVRV